MMRMARDFRLIPIVLLATVCLFALKVSGIVFDGGYTLADRLQDRHKPPGMTVTDAGSVPEFPKITFADQAAPEKSSGSAPWAKEIFNYGDKGDVTGSVGGKGQTVPPPATGAAATAAVNAANAAARAAASNNDITNSAGGGEKKPEANAEPPLKTSTKPPEPTKLEVGGDAYPLAQQGKINSPGERAILGRLQDRRQELDDRGKELEMRESLLKAAEMRLEAKVNELKEIESRIKIATSARDEAEGQRFKGIVAMYENMKPKEAARIFDRLDMRILAEVALSIKPRTMSEILAQMTPESAERLTVELANRANAQPKAATAGELPKIDGKPRS